MVWGCDAVVNITDGGYLGSISKGGEDVHVDLSADLQALDLAACNEPTHLLDWFDPISEVELKAHENCHANLSTAAAYVVDTCMNKGMGSSIRRPCGRPKKTNHSHVESQLDARSSKKSSVEALKT